MRLIKIKHSNVRLILFSISIFLLITIYHHNNIFSFEDNTPYIIYHSNATILNSKCKCRESLELKRVEKSNMYKMQDYLISFDNKSSNTYEVISRGIQKSIHVNPKFSCGLYQNLKRGPNQKVISYSLYGNLTKYYSNLDEILSDSDKIYPGWNIRIYYDHEKLYDKSIICHLECKYAHVDFCNVNEIPYQGEVFDYFDEKNKEKLVNKVSGSVHASMWRFNSITDDFVDVFVSRDTDSPLIQREKDSVDVWLGSKTLYHIMRDSPEHSNVILAGEY